MMSLDYYRILEADENISEIKLKSKYRILAKKYHPDANPGNKEAEKKFREISEAYRILSDKEKRNIFDRTRIMEKTSALGSRKNVKKKLRQN